MQDDDFKASYPLSAIDDFPIHQTPDPIRVMWSSDLQTYERYWTVCHDREGELLVVIGGSFYPSLDLVESFAIVNLRGDHRSIRASRPMGVDRTNLKVGPIKPTIVEGLRLWRYELAPNDWGFQFDLYFHDTHRFVFREPRYAYAKRFPGRQPQPTTGFEGFGVVEGSVTVGSETVQLSPATCTGTRDRHWGTGRGIGGPALTLGRPSPAGISGNTFVAFKGFAIWGDRVYYRRDESRPGAGRVTNVDRRVRFESDTRVFLEAEVDYMFSSGERKTIHFRRCGYQSAYLRCGMYGGTPDGEHWQGAHAVPNLLDGDRHDVSDPENRIRLAGLDEHQCVASCEDETVIGIFQPIDPDAYYACHDQKPGWRFLQ